MPLFVPQQWPPTPPCRMRICHVITSIHFAGAERLLVNLANLHATRHEIDIVYFKNDPDLVAELDPSVRVHQLPLGRGLAARLRAFLAETAPDVLHTHLGHADFVGQWASRGLPMRRFCTMHNIWFKWSWKDHVIFRAYRWLFRRVVPDCHVLCISKSVHEHVRQRLRVPAARASVVHNAIPDVRLGQDRAALRAELDIPQHAFCVLFVGRLERQKSVHTLIEAAARLRNSIDRLRVLIVGAGSLEAELRAHNERLGTDDVVQLRPATRAPERYFAACDVFALPSVFEGFGLVILEAFRAGVAVVATDIEGPAELVQSGVNGLLVPPGDPDQLARRIGELHADPALSARLAETGKQSFTEHFAIERYAAQIEALYQGRAPEPTDG